MSSYGPIKSLLPYDQVPLEDRPRPHSAELTRRFD